jgi:hypothetical protein
MGCVGNVVQQAVATLINGFATSLTLNTLLLNHLLAAMQNCATRAGAAEVATSLHGLAVLGWQSAAWMDLLAQRAGALDPRAWQAQEVAMLAWAVAVLQIDQASLWTLLPQVQLARDVAEEKALSFIFTLYCAKIPSTCYISEALSRVRCRRATSSQINCLIRDLSCNSVVGQTAFVG